MAEGAFWFKSQGIKNFTFLPRDQGLSKFELLKV